MSLDRQLGSGKKCNFKSGSTEYFTCQVVDRMKSQPSPLWNKEFLFLTIHKICASSNNTSEPVYVFIC